MFVSCGCALREILCIQFYALVPFIEESKLSACGARLTALPDSSALFEVAARHLIGLMTGW